MRMSIFAYPQKETPGIAAALGRDNQDYELAHSDCCRLCECGFTFCLGKAKLATGWEAAGWYTGFVVVSALSMILLAKAAKTIPIGTAYPVWTGIGAIGTVLIGIPARMHSARKEASEGRASRIIMLSF